MKKLIFALPICLLAFVCCMQQEEVVEKQELDVLLYMNKLQIYSNKAYFAAKADNKALHSFYVHEMEETMETFIDGGVVLDGNNLSQNMEGFGLGAVKAYEAGIERQGLTNVDSIYSILTNGCNSCHMVSGKPYLVIKEPTTPIFTNQDFSKNEYSDIDVDGD